MLRAPSTGSSRQAGTRNASELGPRDSSGTRAVFSPSQRCLSLPHHKHLLHGADLPSSLLEEHPLGKAALARTGKRMLFPALFFGGGWVTSRCCSLGRGVPGLQIASLSAPAARQLRRRQFNSEWSIKSRERWRCWVPLLPSRGVTAQGGDWLLQSPGLCYLLKVRGLSRRPPAWLAALWVALVLPGLAPRWEPGLALTGRDCVAGAVPNLAALSITLSHPTPEF